MTNPTKTIKVDDDTHRWLALLAADSGNYVYQVLRRMAEDEMKRRGLRLRAARKEQRNGDKRRE